MSILWHLAKCCFPLAATFFTFPLSADESPESIREQYPYAVLESHAVDLGKITMGSRATDTITLSNQGAYPLTITKVRSACGLMIPTWPTKPVAPGETTRITFRYDSSRPGPFERIITIHTNAWQKNLEVKVSGEVVPERQKKPD